MLDLTHALALAACAATAGAMGVPLAFAAAKRSQAQPVPGSVEDERAVLGYLIKEPRTIAEMGNFTPDSFTLKEHQEAWSEFERDLKPHLTDAQADDADSSQLHSSDFPEVAGWLERFSQQPVGRACVAGAATSLAEAREAGETVLTLEVERNTYVGASDIESGPDGLFRKLQRPRAGRIIFASLWMGVVGALAGEIAFGGGTSLEATLRALAVVLLGAASLVWALVDSDTLFLDMPSFYIGAGLCYLPVVVTALVTKSWGNLILAVVCALAVVTVFLVSDMVYRKARGRAGMGGGDSLIALATIGIPVAVTGDALLAYQSLMAALVLAVAGAVVTHLARRKSSSMSRPFAFGPFLAGGWLVAMAWWAVSGS